MKILLSQLTLFFLTFGSLYANGSKSSQEQNYYPRLFDGLYSSENLDTIKFQRYKYRELVDETEFCRWGLKLENLSSTEIQMTLERNKNWDDQKYEECVELDFDGKYEKVSYKYVKKQNSSFYVGEDGQDWNLRFPKSISRTIGSKGIDTWYFNSFSDELFGRVTSSIHGGSNYLSHTDYPVAKVKNRKFLGRVVEFDSECSLEVSDAHWQVNSYGSVFASATVTPGFSRNLASPKTISKIKMDNFEAAAGDWHHIYRSTEFREAERGDEDLRILLKLNGEPKKFIYSHDKWHKLRGLYDPHTVPKGRNAEDLNEVTCVFD